MEAIMRGEAAPDENFRANLPAEEKVLNEFAQAAQAPPQEHAIASIAEAHRPRLTLMATQLAELERLLGKTERLSRWQDVRVGLREIASTYSPIRFPGLPEWKRAQFAAQKTRELLTLRKGETRLPLSHLLDRTASSPLAMVFPFEQMLGELGLGSGAAPVIGLSPQVVMGDIGVLRFAVAHQLGHLLESLGGQPTFTCTLLVKDDKLLSGEGERFANAFAVYLLAPLDEVQQLAGAYPRGKDWYWDAAQDVAATFGLSPRVAMTHLLNCLEESNAKQMLDTFRSDSRWWQYREDVRDHVESAWDDERRDLRERVGDLPDNNVQEALRRPRSATFEQFVSEASERGMLEPSTVDDLRVA
ncbi:ImmA/IrrE family metallo-endopeptidase [Cystobacter ferrugineus]|uniref:IrrE N-terminal-like domain-containing protein n=1 Tax=Cystobacter ferrugineus TaxID=83449 RepID=A0A1L9BJC3_9BACT|nr:hypothetical protein [Cystobacter ferrugineus]OJH42357.1 hypothetical protein BON30_03905 [Cystobacter ferrugineus]